MAAERLPPPPPPPLAAAVVSAPTGAVPVTAASLISTLCPKRRKTESSQEFAETSIEDLLDDNLLLEIFSRLDVQSVLLCRAVTKRWFSLISDPHFIHRLLHRHESLSKSQPFTLLFQSDLYQPNLNKDTIRRVGFNYLNSSVLKSFSNRRGPFLNFLPISNEKVRIEASVNDLLLISCLRHEEKGSPLYRYYVCNPVTRQWRLLPLGRLSKERPLVAVVCNPAQPSNYKVVRVCSQFKVEIFSSQSGEWSRSFPVSSRSLHRPRIRSLVAGNPMLYWLIGDRQNFCSIAAYDPFSNPSQCKIIDAPTAVSEDPIYNHVLGVSRGRLLLVEMTLPSEVHVHLLRIWELEDYSNAGTTWCNTYNISFGSFSARFLANDPCDENVFFIKWEDYVLQCDMQTRRFTVILKREDSLRDMPWESVVTLAHPNPLCPTPVAVPPMFSLS
ncbi:F-box protein At5g07610-like [Malania oleifera]|uniref:F-box protein At5g07610-like n=1 Tax=Malania oleifera TaxID=397392 RepID=UPI0025AE8E1F|nr:F-box protein At5g07610-like [Malania oleifera]